MAVVLIILLLSQPASLANHLAEDVADVVIRFGLGGRNFVKNATVTPCQIVAFGCRHLAIINMHATKNGSQFHVKIQCPTKLDTTYLTQVFQVLLIAEQKNGHRHRTISVGGASVVVERLHLVLFLVAAMETEQSLLCLLERPPIRNGINNYTGITIPGSRCWNTRVLLNKCIDNNIFVH